MIRRFRLRPFQGGNWLLLLLLLVTLLPHKPQARPASGKLAVQASAKASTKSKTARKAVAKEPAKSPATYAERLGWPAGARVVIFHVDDAGMSHDSNVGTIEALEKGVASSASVMMPCSWVSEFAHYWQAHPQLDIGLHLTLTSEWQGYRWGPLAGKLAVPDLVDPEGCLWHSVEEVAAHARPAEIETEIRAQLDRAKALGLAPTHLDTHMWTLMEPSFFPTYLKVGEEEHIPILVFNGHLRNGSALYERMRHLMHHVSKGAWDAGLPVLDELYSQPLKGADLAAKKQELLDTLHALKPGVAQIIVHCTRPSDDFRFITKSGDNRLEDLEIITDPELRECLRREGIIQTTWRELQQRRSGAK